ncbi:hypothetical protein KP79_PYT24614 [Mizuhopecten yessoensis]|uniref:Secreted protein n=1 Tax=Mizuhopecten yessoensis TaxID=6573 RepID=A0A210Q043_MIZYE|nr:hypothetical protein KP79_PYT24614 [Mizuhopecten yessoensis]
MLLSVALLLISAVTMIAQTVPIVVRCCPSCTPIGRSVRLNVEGVYNTATVSRTVRIHIWQRSLGAAIYNRVNPQDIQYWHILQHRP